VAAVTQTYFCVARASQSQAQGKLFWIAALAEQAQKLERLGPRWL